MAEEDKQQQYLRLLCKSFLLQGTDEATARQLLAGQWRVLRFTKGQRIFGAGLNQDYLGLILSGRAVAYSGGTAVLRSFARGDVFGAATLYAPSAETVSRVVAENSGELLLLPLTDIQRLIQEDWRVADNYIRFLAQRIAFLNRKIAAFTAGEAKNRLAAHIAANCRRDEAGRPVLEANISRLAQSLGISRASLYRSLNQLTEQKLLHREGRYIVVDDVKRLTINDER